MKHWNHLVTTAVEVYTSLASLLSLAEAALQGQSTIDQQINSSGSLQQRWVLAEGWPGVYGVSLNRYLVRATSTIFSPKAQDSSIKIENEAAFEWINTHCTVSILFQWSCGRTYHQVQDQEIVKINRESSDRFSVYPVSLSFAWCLDFFMPLNLGFFCKCLLI